MCIYMYTFSYSQSISCRRILSLFSLSNCINAFVWHNNCIRKHEYEYLIGDLNSRIGKRCDFIDHDSILPDFDYDIFSLDTPLKRSSMNSVENRFGDHLLYLCKATEMRIVYGRIFPNTDKMTCFTHNGESVVDYLISSETNFSSLSSMIVHEYNEFSNYAPISFSLKIGTERSREDFNWTIIYFV